MLLKLEKKHPSGPASFVSPFLGRNFAQAQKGMRQSSSKALQRDLLFPGLTGKGPSIPRQRVRAGWDLLALVKGESPVSPATSAWG